MTAFAAILQALQADAALAAILTGGLYDGVTVTDISRQATPGAYDANQELLPCGLLKPESQAPTGPHPDGSRLFVTLWLYQQSGATAIDAARERAYQVLHRSRFLAGGGLWDVRHANDVLGMEMQALGTPAIMSRYVATVNRGGD
jgi:hypothetical protein